jgi:uncharacterized protein DUF2804
VDDQPRMPLVRGGRALKRWRYVAVFAPEAIACFGSVRIAGLPQAFWAIWDRQARRLHERTRFLPGTVLLPPREVHVAGAADVLLEPAGEPVEVWSAHGAQRIWTRKQPALAWGRLLAGGRTIELSGAPALIDDSAGHHARHTAWEWSAGAGTTADGRPVWWNLVAGIHDAPSGSERAVWLDGAPREVGTVRFREGLAGVAFAEDGAALSFAVEAERARRDDLKVLVSDYRQPFGTFGGTLPDGVALAAGLGVMERHDARW